MIYAREEGIRGCIRNNVRCGVWRIGGSFKGGPRCWRLKERGSSSGVPWGHGVREKWFTEGGP